MAEARNRCRQGDGRGELTRRTLQQRAVNLVVTGDSMFVLSSSAKREIRALSFSPDGRFLAAGGSSAGVDVWDVIDRRLVLTAWEEASYIHQVLFSSDGQYLFASASRGGARVI